MDPHTNPQQNVQPSPPPQNQHQQRSWKPMNTKTTKLRSSSEHGTLTEITANLGFHHHSNSPRWQTARSHNDKFAAQPQTNEQHYVDTPRCHCGDNMKSKQQHTHTISCHGCQYEIPKGQDSFFCTTCTTTDHRHFCDECAQHIPKCNKDPIDPRHDSEQLYFLYNNSEISGPHLKHEIITLFVTRKLKEDKLYIMAANHGEWCKLEFPHEIFKDKEYDDENRRQVMAKCEELNAEFKQKYPTLYANLIEHPFTGKLKQISEPDDFPEEHSSITQSRWLRGILGKLIAVALTINIILHCIPTLILSTIAFLGYCCVHCFSTEHMSRFAYIVFIFLFYSGMAITPIINVFAGLTEMNMWDEIQSWMIAYIIWGVVSLIASISHFVLIYFHRDIRILDNAVLLIMGVDFGYFDIVRELEENTNLFEMFGIIFIFPSLASLLPAAVIGFLANYYLEEKFDLKCRDDISTSSEHLCFEEEYGCCEIVSSHDILNAYLFMGGFASTILFVWALIRIAGYLLVQGFPKLALFARQKK